MEEIYRTGRGSFKVRSRWRYDAKENVIEIYEIPYTATAEAVMDKVAELVKAGKVKEISDMRDETDLGGLKLAIDLKRGADPEKLMAKLFKSTPLMDSFACNFNILIAGTPRVMGVREILGEWTAWRLDCVKRRVYFDLEPQAGEAAPPARASARYCSTSTRPSTSSATRSARPTSCRTSWSASASTRSRPSSWRR